MNIENLNMTVAKAKFAPVAAALVSFVLSYSPSRRRVFIPRV